MLRFGWFIFGVVATCAALALGAYLYVNEGGVQIAVDSPEFPFEAALANMALNASFAGSLNLKSPVSLSVDNLTVGAQTFKTHCSWLPRASGRTVEHGQADVPAAAASGAERDSHRRSRVPGRFLVGSAQGIAPPRRPDPQSA